DPATCFRQDPLRLLRGARFASQLDFDPTPETLRGMAEAAGETALLSPDRKREELTRLLLTPDPRKGLRLLMDLGILEFIAPSLLPLKGCMAKPGIDVWEHTLQVVRGVPAAPDLRYAALFHDVSKPRVAVSGTDGSLSFPGHAAASAEMTAEALALLGMPGAESRNICRLIGEHNSFFKCSGDVEFRRLIHRNRDFLEDLLSLMEADKRSVVGGPERYADMMETCRALCSPALLREELSPLSGSDLRRLFGLTGRRAGAAKEYLRERVLEGLPDSGDRHAAERVIKRLIDEGTL
ncbi:MAG: HD domain-containing protein, partial [Abditibacteriota bacterium]|nr:HD domain-containing protein [Abditibacteriota bacterium]